MKSSEKEPFVSFNKLMVLNAGLGLMGFAGLWLTFYALGYHPGLTLQPENPEGYQGAGFGTGFLGFLYLVYLVVITLVVWDKDSRAFRG